MGPVLSGEVRPSFYSDGVLVSLSSLPDLPTLRPRLDDPQFRRGGDHFRCERRRGLLYGRTTAREASQRVGPGQAGMRYLIVSKYVLEQRVRLSQASGVDTVFKKKCFAAPGPYRLGAEQ